ncbi:MAG: enoyl-CoA hydratase/isomerase family protein [Burkholderiaceae bacterium]|nr:enoyl-CoA hydratase/isomerase family protein [Burkholderiaceae bacterium]
MTTDPPLLYELRGSAGWLTLNRPAALNALTPELMLALRERLGEIETDHRVRVVVLTGAGRAFCAGVDLSALGRDLSPADATAAFMRIAEPATDALQALPKPVIAAVNGHAFAGGLELVLRCDLVLAAAEARFSDGHANFGLIPGGGSSARLPRRVGLSLAKYMIYTGAQVEAEALMDAGLVHRVVPRAELDAAVDALAHQLAAKSPLALARGKQLIAQGLELPEAEAARREAAAAIAHCHSKDVAEGLAAFTQKRTPVFTGE